MQRLLLFFVFGCGLLFVACDSQPKEEKTRLFGDFSLITLTTPEGKQYTGLARGEQTLIAPEQDSIVWNIRLNGFMVYADDRVCLYNRSGQPYLSGSFKSVSKVGPYVQFVDEFGIYLADKKYDKFVGPLEEYVIMDHFIFAKRQGLWGLYTTDLTQIIEERYGILFIADMKSLTDFKLLACRGGSWYVFDAAGNTLSEESEKIRQIVTSQTMPKNIGIISADIRF